MIHSLWDLFFVGDGREPIAEELSGGQFLPPVQTLVATLIFCLKAENANRVPLSAPKKGEAFASPFYCASPQIISHFPAETIV
jgi:hypothetical protein